MRNFDKKKSKNLTTRCFDRMMMMMIVLAHHHEIQNAFWMIGYSQGVN